MNIEKIRKEFPILTRKIKGNKLVYLDNSATSQKPKQVIDAITDFYKNYNSNIHRGVHKLSEEATIAYEESHAKVAKFINAEFEETIFTRGTTESLNLLAQTLKYRLNKGDEILLTEMEHHSNIVPWQIIAKEKELKLKFVEVTKDGTLDLESFKSLISNKTKIVSVIHMSNVLGTINPVKELGEIAHKYGALFIVDAAQSIPHMKIDVKNLNCDFLAFSGHKMFGPTGIGVLYGKKYLLEEMPPYMTGGDMIKEVTLKESFWNDLPWKFEAGTPNIAGGIGLGMAVDYINKIGLKNIEEYERQLTKEVFKVLKNTDFIELYGPKENRGPVFSFNVKGIHAHDISSLLDDYGVAVRGGHHCAMPLMKKLGINGSVRASFSIYNTKEELNILVDALEKVRRIFQ
ncbi:MAG: cysteine desulfurase [archaeon]